MSKEGKKIYIKQPLKENIHGYLSFFGGGMPGWGDPDVKYVKNGKIDYKGYKIPVSKLVRRGNYEPSYYHDGPKYPLYSVPRKVLKTLKKKRKRK